MSRMSKLASAIQNFKRSFNFIAEYLKKSRFFIKYSSFSKINCVSIDAKATARLLWTFILKFNVIHTTIKITNLINLTKKLPRQFFLQISFCIVSSPLLDHNRNLSIFSHSWLLTMLQVSSLWPKRFWYLYFKLIKKPQKLFRN